MPDETALIAAIDAFSEQAIGSDNDDGELSRQRALALDAYSGKIIDAAPEGRSQVSDRAVFETVQWIMPSLMRIFAGGDNVVEFEPVGPDDEETAEQESDYLNYMVQQKGDYELMVREWCQDALVTKNAYCLVDMEERLIPEVERYEGQVEEQVALLLEDDLEVVGQKQYDDPDDEGTLIDPATGQPIDPQDQATMVGAMAIYEAMGEEPQRQYRQLYDVEVKRVKAKKQLRFDVLPPERCRIAIDTKDFTLENCSYFEYWDNETISDLRKLGFDIDDDVSDDPYGETQEDEARNEELELDDWNDGEHPDPSMRKVMTRTIWVRYDYDGDGIAELQKVVRVGREILDHEPASRIPVASIVPFINTHRHIGNSVADLVFDVQRIKTSLLLSGLDSNQLALNSQKAISNKVNISDLLKSRAGGLVRVNTDMPDVAGHVQPLMSQDTMANALQAIQHMDTVIESRVGVNRMFQGIDTSNINDHNRIGQLSTMAAQRVEDIARLFGTGFKRLFSLAHEAIIKSGHSQETVKLRGKWVNIDPSTWRTGRDMRVTAPYAAGNKDSLVQRIMLHMQVHEKALAGGLPIVDAQDSYNLAMELAKATDLVGTQIYTDPSTVQPKEPPPDHTMIALEIENKKADDEAADEQRKAELDKYKADLDAQAKEQVARIQAETQIYLAQIKAGESVDVGEARQTLTKAAGSTPVGTAKMLNQQIADSIGQITDAIADLKQTATAPKEILRDNDGKIIGVKVNGETRIVQRDEKGRVTGL